MTQQGWKADTARHGVVLAGGSQFIRDQVARACAAAGITPVVVNGIAEALHLDPEVLLVGVDAPLDQLSATRDVIVVAAADEEARVWGKAARLASSRVVIVPQGGGWLAEHLGRRLHPGTGGSVIGFTGVSGGCGVSSFAFWCARTLSAEGHRTLLVDGHPAGGGLEVSIGWEEHPGVRWEDLEGIRGMLNADQLSSALPTVKDLSVLSHRAPSGERARGGLQTTAEAGGIVLDAARAGFDLTLVDLPSGQAGGGPLAQLCDALVLLVPSRPRGIMAAGAALRSHAALPVTVVLRGPVTEGLDAWCVAEMLGVPGPLPFLPTVRGASAAEVSGRQTDLRLPRKARRTVDTICRVVRGPV